MQDAKFKINTFKFVLEKPNCNLASSQNFVNSKNRAKNVRKNSSVNCNIINYIFDKCILHSKQISISEQPTREEYQNVIKDLV